MIESAFGWIGQIVEWFGKFIPRVAILNTTMGAVKYVRGKNPVACGPGLHIYWPFVTEFDTYPTARQTDDLRTQTIVTTDDKTVVVGGLIVYRVHDLLKLLPTTYDAASAIKELSLTAIHDVCCRMSWAELKTEKQKGTLDTKLRNAARRALEDYGVEMIKVQLTDLAPARVYKILQATSKDEE